MRSAGAGDGGGGHGMSNANNGVGHSMSWGGGELRPGEPYSHRKWPTLNWLLLRFTGNKSGSGWLAGRLATAWAWGMAPQTSGKAPSRGF